MAETLTPENVMAVLLERVPAFARARSTDESFMSHGDDSTYLCFGDFGLYLQGLLERQPQSSEEVETIERSFALLNEMGNSPDPEVVNIAAVNVFEALAGEVEIVNAARQHLTGQAADQFERIVSWFSPA